MNAMTEMPRYKSHKQVWALEIASADRLTTKVTFTDEGCPDRFLPAEMWSRYQPVAGDFYVEYTDGYKSFSPRKAFLEGYSREGETENRLVDLTKMRGLQTAFLPNTIVSEDSLIIDRFGVAWFVRPRAMQIVKAGMPHVKVHKLDDGEPCSVGGYENG